jgi:dTDP-4-amino-4,6-dideoxygalactose transaminase
VHAFHLYVVRSSRRDALRAFLKDRGVESGIHYPAPVHLQKAYAALAAPGSLPEAEKASREVLSLPMYPELEQDDVETVLNAVKAFAPEAA